MMASHVIIIITCIHIILAMEIVVGQNNNDSLSVSPQQPHFPAIFVFGDSLTDSGNNNQLVTIGKAIRPPYGQDFPTHQPTGRFTNGLLITDYIALLAGVQFPRPYASIGDDILQGACFSSSGSGVLNSTGSIIGEHIPLSKQIQNFMVLKQGIETRLGIERAKQHFRKSLFFVAIGNNDYIVNYLVSGGKVKSPLQLQYSSVEFANLIQSNIEERIKELYEMGARKFAVVGTSVFGCIPIELFLRRVKDGRCIESINDLSKDYNMLLTQRLQRIQDAFPNARFTYLNAYDFVLDIINNPERYGFESSNKACCGIGPYNGVPCILLINPNLCEDASKYVFWDSVHPTSTINHIVAKRFWSGEFPDVSPFNLNQLASIDL